MKSYLCAISRTLLACLLLTGMAHADELYPFSYEFPMTCPGGKEEVGSIEIEREPSHFRAIRRQFHQEAAKAGCEISPEFDEFARTMGQMFRSDAEGTMKLLHDSPPLSKQVTTVPVLAVPMICDKTRPLRDLTLHDDWMPPPRWKDDKASIVRSKIKMRDDITAFQEETGCRLEPRALELLWQYRAVAEREGYNFSEYAQQEFPADWEDYLSYRSAALVGTATTYEVLADCRGAKGHVFELWLRQPFEGTQTPSKNLAKAVKDSGLKKCKAVPPTDKFVGALALLADRTIRDFDPGNPWEKFDAYYCGLEARKVDECRRELPEDALPEETVAEARESPEVGAEAPKTFGFDPDDTLVELSKAIDLAEVSLPTPEFDDLTCSMFLGAYSCRASSWPTTLRVSSVVGKGEARSIWVMFKSDGDSLGEKRDAYFQEFLNTAVAVGVLATRSRDKAEIKDLSETIDQMITSSMPQSRVSHQIGDVIINADYNYRKGIPTERRWKVAFHFGD